MGDFYTAKDLRGKTPEQLEKILSEKQERLRHERFSVSAKEVKNNQKVKMMRKEIARIHTVAREKDINPAK
ncbi:MAG: 50S ribosomal protein L29 [Candidatus Doudnabacteria bacterium]|nr:50S ribosomal protein L29 [Candidatus Doudnabacteria bacterium]